MRSVDVEADVSGMGKDAKKIRRGRCFLFLLLALTGCGSRQPPLHAVTGTVRFEGQPAAGFAVEFSSDDAPTKGISAIGVADPQGRFVLETRQAGRQKAGAVAGRHRVVVLPPPAFGDAATTILPVPLRYADYRTSGLTADVQAGQGNEVLLDLNR